MRIAYVYDAVYPFVKGGVEKRIYEISKRLVKRGNEVHLYGMKWWDGADVITKDDIILHGVCEPKELYTDGRRSIKEAVYFASKVINPLLNDNFDVIDCQAFPYFPCLSAKICSYFKKTSFIITWHEVWNDYWFEYLGKKGFFGKTVEKMTSHLTDKNIAVSKSTKRDLKNLGVRKDIKVIPNGIDYKSIGEIVPKKTRTDVIFVGRLIKEKNVDILIKAINLVSAEVPEVKGVIIGSGPKKEELEKLVKNLGLENNIRFTGFLEDYGDVISYMKSSKVFVLPSTREGFGISALEANACGLPVITVDHIMNATRDLIKDGENGFLSGLNEKGISEKILKSFEWTNEKKRQCIEYAKVYEWDKIVLLAESFYKGVGKDKNSGKQY